MNPHVHRVFLLVTVAVWWTTDTANAQTKTPAEWNAEASRLVDRLRAMPDDDAEAKHELVQTFLAPLFAHEKSLTAEHYIEVSSPFLRAKMTDLAVKICNSGIEAFPESRFLHDNLGIARLVQVNQSDTREAKDHAARAARDSFRRATALEPDTYHAHAGLSQALEYLGEYAAALASWEKTLKFDDLPHRKPHRKHGELLMRNARMGEAAAAFAKSLASNEPDGHEVRILEMRSLLLAGERERAEAAAHEILNAMGPPPEVLLLAAIDVCSEAGDPKAVDRLAKLMDGARTFPLPKDADDPKDFLHDRNQARAILRILLTDARKAPNALREDIRAAVGHRVIFQGGGQEHQALENHPLLVFVLCETRDWSEIAWAEEILVALCAHAVLGEAPSTLCRKIAKSMAGEEIDLGELLEPEELRSRITGLEKTIFDPTFPAAFAARKLMRQLTNARPGDEKKSPKSPSK